MTMSDAPRAASISFHGAAADAPPISSAVLAAWAMVRLTMVIAAHALGFHMERGQLSHFARADDDHASSLEIAENLLRERDGRKADGHRAWKPSAVSVRTRLPTPNDE